ncbi:signal peptide peptidase SppA [Candidatus Woesearchaeota archaeon]|nr:signal peptide peptidase SppA [Candidatus Woesearchaeota archaeon]
MILSDSIDTPFGEESVSSVDVVEFLDEANKDKNVKGIILEINSPGGSALASKEIVDKVKSIEKPIVSWIREVGASGAYWVASASDKIIADELSITGSIGVISSYLEFSGLLQDYNVTYEDLKTGKYKGIKSPYKKLTDEEREILLKKLELIHKIFSDDVSKNRKKDLNSVSNGLFYLGKEALDLGLIDILGGKEIAINTTKQLANVTEAETVRFEKKMTLIDVLQKFGASAFYSFGKGFGSFLVSKNDAAFILK